MSIAVRYKGHDRFEIGICGHRVTVDQPGTPGDRTSARPPPSCSWRAWQAASASTPNGSSGATTCRPRASRFGATTR